MEPECGARVFNWSQSVNPDSILGSLSMEPESVLGSQSVEPEFEARFYNWESKCGAKSLGSEVSNLEQFRTNIRLG